MPEMSLEEFHRQAMQIDGVHGVGTSSDNTVAHIYASKTREVKAWVRFVFPEGIGQIVVHRCGAPRPAKKGAPDGE